MKDMSQRVQQLNAFNMSSCEAAQRAVSSLWPAMDGASSTICQQVGGAKGFFSDAAAARGCTNKGEREDTIARCRRRRRAGPVEELHLVCTERQGATKPSRNMPSSS
jgi:conjugative transfer pilus assembly protein TraH